MPDTAPEGRGNPATLPLGSKQAASNQDCGHRQRQRMQSLLFDTTELESEQSQLFEETQVVSDMVQQAIQENSKPRRTSSAERRRNAA
jgi:hypothetical protein